VPKSRRRRARIQEVRIAPEIIGRREREWFDRIPAGLRFKTKVSSIPSSDRSRVRRLVSWVAEIIHVIESTLEYQIDAWE